MKDQQEQFTNLAHHLRLAVEIHGRIVSEDQGVCGVGVAWQGGTLSFVVETRSATEATRLKAALPDFVEGLPVVIRVSAPSTQTSGEVGGGRGADRVDWH